MSQFDDEDQLEQMLVTVQTNAGPVHEVRALPLRWLIRVQGVWTSDGLSIARVTPGGPATKMKSAAGTTLASLEAGDVITSINDLAILDGDDWSNAIAGAPDHSRISLSVINVQDGRVYEWFVAAQKRPDPPNSSASPKPSMCVTPIVPVGPSTNTAPDIPGMSALVGTTTLFWENGTTLKVHFLDGSSTLHSRVRDIVSEWAQYVNLKFAFFDDPSSPPTDAGGNATDISVTFWSEGGGQSYLGSSSRGIARGGNASMHLPNDPQRYGFKRVVLHEFGHALGFQHEHLSPVAGIKWDKAAVYKYYADEHGWDKAKVDNNLFKVLEKSTSNHSAFDPKSIMVYAIPAELTTDGVAIGYNLELSDLDKEWAAKMYPLANRCSKCKGLGIIEVPSTNPFGGPPPLLPFQYVTCNVCQGDGVV